MVIPLLSPTFNRLEAGTVIKPEVPLKLNDCPTRPEEKLTPLEIIPELPSAMSFAFPSAGHQLTRPEGTGTQLVCAWRSIGSAANAAATRLNTIRFVKRSDTKFINKSLIDFIKESPFL